MFQMYDVSVVRAVAELRVLVEYCLPFLKVGGILVAAKGPVVQVSPECDLLLTQCFGH